MTTKKLPSPALKRQKQEERYQVPPSILGKPDRRKKPSWKKIEKMLFDVLEQAHGKKLHKYQKDFIRAIWNHDAISKLK